MNDLIKKQLNDLINNPTLYILEPIVLYSSIYLHVLTETSFLTISSLIKTSSEPIDLTAVLDSKLYTDVIIYIGSRLLVEDHVRHALIYKKHRLSSVIADDLHNFMPNLTVESFKRVKKECVDYLIACNYLRFFDPAQKQESVHHFLTTTLKLSPLKVKKTLGILVKYRLVDISII